METHSILFLDEAPNWEGSWRFFSQGKISHDYKILNDIHYFATPVDENQNYVPDFFSDAIDGSSIIISDDYGANWRTLVELQGYKKVQSFDFDNCENIFFTDYDQGLFRISILSV